MDLTCFCGTWKKTDREREVFFGKYPGLLPLQTPRKLISAALMFGVISKGAYVLCSVKLPEFARGDTFPQRKPKFALVCFFTSVDGQNVLIWIQVSSATVPLDMMVKVMVPTVVLTSTNVPMKI